MGIGTPYENASCYKKIGGERRMGKRKPERKTVAVYFTK